MLALARQMETNLKADLESFGTRDTAALTRMYSSLMGIAMVKRDHAAARRYLELVRDLQDNPAVKLLTGVITIPSMQAMETPGADFRATYRTLLSTRLASLPFEDVQATLGAMKNSQESASKAQLIGSIVAGVDPAVKDGQLSQQIAEALVGAAMNLEVIRPLKEDVVACIENFFNSNKTFDDLDVNQDAALTADEVQALSHHVLRNPPGRGLAHLRRVSTVHSGARSLSAQQATSDPISDASRAQAEEEPVGACHGQPRCGILTYMASIAGGP